MEQVTHKLTKQLDSIQKKISDKKKQLGNLETELILADEQIQLVNRNLDDVLLEELKEIKTKTENLIKSLKSSDDNLRRKTTLNNKIKGITKAFYVEEKDCPVCKMSMKVHVLHHVVKCLFRMSY